METDRGFFLLLHQQVLQSSSYEEEEAGVLHAANGSSCFLAVLAGKVRD